MDFCTQLGNQLMLNAVGRQQNIAVSPVSVNALLNVVAVGSTGATLDHLLGILGSKDVDEIHYKTSRMMALVATEGDVGPHNKKKAEEAEDGTSNSAGGVNGGRPDQRLFPTQPWCKDSFINGGGDFASQGRTLSPTTTDLFRPISSSRGLFCSKSSEERAAAGAGDVGPHNNGKDGPILTMVNEVLVDKRFPLKPSYKELLQRVYKCTAKNVDFANETQREIEEVNSWAARVSKGHIENIVQPGSMSSYTSIVLANELYFKGIWDSRHKFDAKYTEKRDFYLLNGNTVSVPFMTSSHKYHFGAFDGFQALKIPYQSGKSNNRFSMYFFLPNKRDGLQNLLEKFSSDPGFLQQRYFNLREESLKEFWIPKFKFSFGFDVSSVMEGMEPSLSVVQNPKDLSEMMHIPEDILFFIPRMFQKVFIEVDEIGTEARAISYMSIAGMGCAMPPPPIYSFVADHPFVFMIKEETLGLIFFIGAVLDPK